jgi:hypothetical protein
MRLPKRSVDALLAGFVVLSSVRGQHADHAIQPPVTPIVPPPSAPPLLPPGFQPRVHYSDIPERVLIIGKLGQPLGQLVTVRGTWTAPYPSKPGLPVVLVVNQVNGNPIDSPAKFDVVEPVWERDEEVTKRAVGEEWELRGVETGGFVGFGDKVWEELGQQPASRPPRGFLTRFCYVKAKRIYSSTPTR